MGDWDIGHIPANIPPEEEILGMKVQDKEVGMKISTTLPCSMLEKQLMDLGEVDLGLGPALLPTTIQGIMVYHLIFIVMVIT